MSKTQSFSVPSEDTDQTTQRAKTTGFANSCQVCKITKVEQIISLKYFMFLILSNLAIESRSASSTYNTENSRASSFKIASRVLLYHLPSSAVIHL